MAICHAKIIHICNHKGFPTGEIAKEDASPLTFWLPLKTNFNKQYCFFKRFLLSLKDVNC